MTQTTNYPHKIQLSDTAEAVIAGYADALVLDRLQLWQLPISLLTFHTFAFEAGRTVGLESREGLDRLRFEADLFYWCYTNRKPPGDWYRHATNELWDEATR